MGIENVGRLIILNGTSAAVEAETATLAEIVFGRDSVTGAIGYSVDDGASWTWLPASSGAISLDDLDDVVITSLADGEVLVPVSGNWINKTLAEAGIAAASHTHASIGKYRQFTYIVSGGDFSFIIDGNGEPVMVLQELE